jgi:CRP/FNR family transcriptional regulator, cyclic AMP receptor protein
MSLVTVAQRMDFEAVELHAHLHSRDLPAELISELTRENIIVRHAKGYKLFQRGASADMLMLITSGVVKVYCSEGESRRFLVELAGPGDIIGYADFLDVKGRRCQAFEAEALTNCSVALVVRQRITKQLETLESSVLVPMIERINRFWTTLAYRYAVLMSFTYRERLELALIDVAQRFGVKDARGTMLSLELGHQEWAEMIGSSRPMVSRLLAQMIEAGMIVREGKLYILLKDGGLDGAVSSVRDSVARTLPLAQRSLLT